MAESKSPKKKRIKDEGDPLKSSSQDSDLKTVRADTTENIPQTLTGRTSSAESAKIAAVPIINDEFYVFERANEMIRRSDFEKALPLLESISETSERRLLMTSECYLQLGLIPNATRSIDSLSVHMASQNIRPDDVMELIDEYINNNNCHIRSFILLSCTSKLFKEISDFQRAIKGIRSCSAKFSIDVFPAQTNANGGNESRRNIVKCAGIGLIKDMLVDMRSVPCENFAIRAVHEARVINNIGWCHNCSCEYEETVRILKTGVVLMEQWHGSDAGKYQIYGDLLYNIGLNYWSLDDLNHAKMFFEKAIVAYEIVENWESEAMKIDHKNKANADLESVKISLENPQPPNPL